MGKRKRCAYSASSKLKVVQFANENTNAAASRKFDIPESNIRLWRQQEHDLLEMPKAKEARRGKPAKHPDLEKELVEWVEAQRQNGLIITHEQVKMQAKKMSKDFGNLGEHFHASTGWCNNFLKRHSLVTRQKTKISQKLPQDLDDKVLSFQKFVIDLRKEQKFDLCHIGNMDETPMFFDMLSNRTVDRIGAKTVYVRTTGHEKTHFTAVLCCLANGTKLPPMIIFKRKSIPKGEKFPNGIIVHCHPKGWMDENGICLWLDKVWDKRPGASFKRPALLVWDQFRGHLTDEVKKKLTEMKTKQAVIPGGLTSVLQPLDVVLNKPFKNEVKKQWAEWMGTDEVEKTAKGNLKKPGLSTVAMWVKLAWDSLQSSMVVKSFLKTGISNKLDGTQDDLLWEDEGESDFDE